MRQNLPICYDFHSFSLFYKTKMHKYLSTVRHFNIRYTGANYPNLLLGEVEWSYLQKKKKNRIAMLEYCSSFNTYFRIACLQYNILSSRLNLES